MKILIVTHYFPPEIGAPQARLSDLARMWASSGLDVTVLTGMPNHPTGIVPTEYRRKLRLIEHVDGYRIVRTWLYATPNEGIVKKTLGHLSFMCSSVLLGLGKVGKPDVVMVSSPTFFSIGAGWTIARLRRARLIVEVRDLWPAIFVELGVLTNRTAIAALERLELASYRAADAVVVVSEGFRTHITARGIPADKVHTIRNGVDIERFQPAEHPSPDARRRLGAPGDEILVLYIGAHGLSQGLGVVVEAAALIPDKRIRFALVGEGADKANVLSRIRDLQITNMVTLDGVARDDVPGLLAAADICLVPLRDVPLFSTFIPSKIFEYLAAGRPVVASVRGEPGEILREAGAIVVEPEQPEALAAAIVDLAADGRRRSEMSRSGREYVMKNFDRKQLAAKYAALIENVIGK
ncbi:MAG: glycosyltransferase family 4 protein [Ilumatobacteraceae bacterium]